VPGKNIKPLLGKPLLAHSVELAAKSGLFDQVVVTSDSQSYLDIASDFGATMLIHRPSELAVNTVSKLGAIEHAVSFCESELNNTFDTIVDLDVTSPLRVVDDVIGALKLYCDKNPTSVITGCSSHRSPYTNLIELDESGCVLLSKPLDMNISRRQDSPLCFDMNASIYIWDRASFRNDPKVFYEDTLLYEMPFERSWDIDTEMDFEIVEFLMLRSLNK
jgi:N-acylneuraminate cytidylyltransferase/CMP-N,N'-diacetyllegionaminic acid synthase